MSADDEDMQEQDLDKLMAADPAFESRLRAALEIDVPALQLPDLDDIDDESVAVLPVRPRRRAPVRLALAASVALAAFLGARFFEVPTDAPSLEAQLLAHLDHERASLTVTDRPVADAVLAAVVPASVATMNHDAGLITYAMSCTINGHDVPHLVIQGKKGPVTILLMPEETVEAARSIEGESVNGVILPVGDGSIAIIGEKDESLDEIRKNVLDSVSWST